MPTTKPLGPMVRIKEVRKAHNLTLKELAAKIGEHGVLITEAGLSNVENGNKVASERLLTGWSLALGLDTLEVWQGPLREPIKAGVPQRDRKLA